MHNVEIRRAPALRVIGVEHRGPYPQIGRAFAALHQLATARGLYGSGCRLVAVYFDEARDVPPEEQRALAAMTVREDVQAGPPLVEAQLSAGEYAVLRHQGPYDGLGAAYDWLIGTWLAQSGRTAADLPCYEIYSNTPADTAPADLITDIHLPLAAIA